MLPQLARHLRPNGLRLVATVSSCFARGERPEHPFAVLEGGHSFGSAKICLKGLVATLPPVQNALDHIMCDSFGL
jgi:hypothetical protein